MYYCLVYFLVFPDLIKFIHGNTSGIKVAPKNFIEEFVKNDKNMDDNSISLSVVKKSIKHIATKSTNMSPWYIQPSNYFN